MNFYIVTQSQFSNYGKIYRIIGLFDSHEMAQLFINSFGNFGDKLNMKIESCELNKFKAKIKKGFKPFKVHISRDGNTEVTISNDGYLTANDEFHWYDAPGIIHSIAGYSLIVHCFAKNAAQANKIANKKRLQLLADNQWKTE